ncbi:MAG: hypothetical protein ABW154_11725 [Dyella sp.]
MSMNKSTSAPSSLGEPRIISLLWMLPVLVFLSCIAVQIQLPGLYMDAVNPDFIAAQWLHHHLRNPSAALPSKIFPLLGNLYHGVQNAYVALPFLAILGFSVTSLRLAQALFGVILLIAFHGITRLLSRSPWLGLAATLGLATELAFSASFRTQFYIVMGGATWLFVSLRLLYSLPTQSRPGRRILWAGFFSGLAGYGYFVLFFFAPGMLAIVILRKGANRHLTLCWILGFAFGLSPFVFGYISLALKLHGIGPMLHYVGNLVGQLHPFASGSANFYYAWHMVTLALSDAGNESMIFGEPLLGWWGGIKVLVGTLSTLGTLILLAILLWRRDPRRYTLLPVLLPVSYLLMATLFGHRLWAHHFCVLVPFVYLLPLCLWTVTTQLLSTSTRLRLAVFLILTALCLTINLAQQVSFQRALAISGGYGKSVEALNELGIAARRAGPDVAYVFPEWGFFTSFCILTGNQVRYVIDLEPATLTKLKQQGYRELRLFYWEPPSVEGYRQQLQQAGLIETSTQQFKTRDDKPAFYGLTARWLP